MNVSDADYGSAAEAATLEVQWESFAVVTPDVLVTDVQAVVFTPGLELAILDAEGNAYS